MLASGMVRRRRDTPPARTHTEAAGSACAGRTPVPFPEIPEQFLPYLEPTGILDASSLHPPPIVRARETTEASQSRPIVLVDIWTDKAIWAILDGSFLRVPHDHNFLPSKWFFEQDT